MALISPSAPPASLAAIAEIVPRLAAMPSPAGQTAGLHTHLQDLARSGGSTQPKLSTPVYVLGLDELRDAKGVITREPALWMHVLSSRSQTEAPIVSADTSGDPSQVTAVSQGAGGGAFWKSYGAVETLPDVARSDFELAELRVPALRVDAFLLRGRSPDLDIVMPYRSQQTDVVVGKSYPIRTFMELLRPAASAVLSQQGEGKGG